MKGEMSSSGMIWFRTKFHEHFSLVSKAEKLHIYTRALTACWFHEHFSSL